MTDEERRQPGNYWVKLNVHWLVACMRLIDSNEVWYVAGAAKAMYYATELRVIGPPIPTPDEIARLNVLPGSSTMERAEKILVKWRVDWPLSAIGTATDLIRLFASAIEQAERDARAQTCQQIIATCEHVLASATPQSGWRPIESAPRDGTEVDLWCTQQGLSTVPARSPDCWYSSGSWWQYDEQGDDQCRREVHNATYWMPLPDPPRSA